LTPVAERFARADSLRQKARSLDLSKARSLDLSKALPRCC
jgi:hypothetical protein